jgi:hypothetical protein
MALDEATNPMQGVSGPGTYSKRTDLSYQSQSYGDGVAYDAAKSGAPLSTAPKNPKLSESPVVPTGRAVQSSPTELFAPTGYPERDVMHGNKMGPGAGPEVLAGAKPVEKLSDTLVKMLPFDTDGSIAILYQNALARGN